MAIRMKIPGPIQSLAPSTLPIATAAALPSLWGSVQWASEISTHNSTQTVGTFTLSDQTVDGTGSIDWTYSIADYLIADKITANSEVSYLSLDSGENFAETFTVTIDDGDGETVTQDVVITVNGANDFDAQDDFAVVAEGGLISVGNNANQSVGNPITDASSTFDAAFEGSEVWLLKVWPSIMMGRSFIFLRTIAAKFNSTRFRHNLMCRLPAQNIRYTMELIGREIWCLTLTAPRHSRLIPAQTFFMNIP